MNLMKGREVKGSRAETGQTAAGKAAGAARAVFGQAEPGGPAREEKRKRKRIPLQVYLVYLVVATFLVTGVTVSRYVATGSGNDDARVAKMGQLTISENGTEIADNETREFIVTPGVDIKKDVKVKYTKSEMASYIFLEVDVTGWTGVDSGQGNDNLNFGVPFTDQNGATDYKVKWAIDGGWKFLQTDVIGDVKKNVYYKVVKAGEDNDVELNVIGSVINGGVAPATYGVTVSPKLKKSDIDKMPPKMNIGFRAIAVQLDGFEKNNSNITLSEEHAKAAWASAKNNMGN